MATQTRKRTVKSKTPVKPTRRRRTSAVRRSPKSAGNFANFFVPLFFILCIVFCLGFLGFMGYRTVTASEFFDVKKIDVRGTSRASKDEIEKIVESISEKTGVWNADLNLIQEKVEKLSYVKAVSVSRVLPDGVRVNVTERVPKAVVRLNNTDFWVDEESAILGEIGKNEERPPFFMSGWDNSKVENAAKDNQARVKVYQKMLEDWREFDLAKRVKEVNLTDLRDPQAFIEDSGETIKVILPKDNFSKTLQKALETIAGFKGRKILWIDVSGVQPVVEFK